MPRVKLGTPTPAQQLATMNKIIRKAMVDQEIEDCTVLALRMGMDPQVARRRLRYGNWKMEELWRLVRVLQLTAEQVGVMLGASPRPTA